MYSENDMAFYRQLLEEAKIEARHGLSKGGIPIGAVLAKKDGTIVARGHNRRVQDDNPISHGETDCFLKAGRRRDWHELILASTLSPCEMCTGTTLLFKIPIVIIGENTTYRGAEEFFEQRGVHLINLNDPECIAMMQKFIRERPDLWHEDIGIPKE